MAKQTAKPADKPSFVVVKSFRDKSNFKREYAIDEDVSYFDEKRIEHLVSIGYVKTQEPEAAAKDSETGEKDPE